MKGQIPMPLPAPAISIDAGVRHLLRASLQISLRRWSRLNTVPVSAAEQVPILLKIRPMFRNKRTGRPCRYPFEMIQDARVMRENGFEYKEIAAALGELYKDELRKIGVEQPAWISVRDWTSHYYRLRG